MPRDKSLPPQLYLFEHNMPSRNKATEVEKGSHTHAPRKLTYAEHVAARNGARNGVQSCRSQPAGSQGTVALAAPHASAGSKQNTNVPNRASSVRRQKAHDDLRMSAYASKPLPALPPEAAKQPQASSVAREMQKFREARVDERKRSIVDEAVRSVKHVAKRCKSKYTAHKKKVRLSLAWEVEEIV